MRTAVLAGAARRPTSKPSPMASTPRDASSPLTTDAVPSSELYELENPLAILANLSLGHEFDDGLGGEGSASEVSQEQTDWVAQSQRFYGAGKRLEGLSSGTMAHRTPSPQACTRLDRM